MRESFVSTLRAAGAFEDGNEAASSGSVRVRIVSIDRAELSIPDARCEIGIERGTDEEGRPGWYIYPEDTKAWDDGTPLGPEERTEVTRLLKAALSCMGYQVWADE